MRAKCLQLQIYQKIVRISLFAIDKFYLLPPIFVWVEFVSASCGLASCSGRRSGGHLHHPCGPKGAICRRHRHRMTGRIGLRHRDSRGTDTSHTLKSRWTARRLPVKRYKKQLTSLFCCLSIASMIIVYALKSGGFYINTRPR